MNDISNQNTFVWILLLFAVIIFIFYYLNGNEKFNILNMAESESEIYKNMKQEYNLPRITKKDLNQYKPIYDSPIIKSKEREPVINENVMREQVMREQVMNRPEMIDQVMNRPEMREQVMNRPEMIDQVMREQVMREQVMNKPEMIDQVMREQVMREQVMNRPEMREQVMREQVMNKPEMRESEMKQQKKLKKKVRINEDNLSCGARSLYEMNQVGKKDAEQVNCNLLGLNTSKMNNYKKNYYKLYSHQVECPKECGMNELGMNKCGMGSTCGNCTNSQNITRPGANVDVNALGYLALNDNNKKPCVTCAKRGSCSCGKNVNNLNREYLEGFNNLNTDNYETLSPEKNKEDVKRLLNKNVVDANISNFVNFENNVNLDSIKVNEVDKMAEIRTCENGTCGLKSYGSSIANAYDKLVSNPSYANRNNGCKSYNLTGVSDSGDNMYANV
jgi:hypothetical protein